MGIEVKRNVMEKGWKHFMIMSQDRRVASIREDGTCTIYAKRLMPYDLYLEPVKYTTRQSQPKRLRILKTKM